MSVFPYIDTPAQIITVPPPLTCFDMSFGVTLSPTDQAQADADSETKRDKDALESTMRDPASRAPHTDLLRLHALPPARLGHLLRIPTIPVAAWWKYVQELDLS
ncbi:hypothetical protein PPTG_21515 [Phytophthora nicotianae INRA-310]|uniref:Uncharacterized protein n=3 Tax=Phytophthora nicotianae TaxID=4792 RepID=W2QXY1_PHYN3|nr:hypothetical protein PPTG_21515 [Phytophthora nicotianae INRA-310]ETN18092.1 hypothetical protein PPTG_21515 [Phytophthora nicotianae INRA-310]